MAPAVIGTAHRVAAALSVVLLVLLALAGGRYLQAHGGWNIDPGSNDLMTLMLLALGFVLTLSFALLRPGGRNVDGARLTSLVWTLALLLCLVFTFRVIVVADRWAQEVGTRITSPQELEAFVAAHPESFAAYDYRVPTGVYLQSFEFLNSSNVEMAGFIWQKYGPEIPDHVLRGIVLPEAVEEAYQAEEVWRIERDGVEEIGWFFSGTIRQIFTTSCTRSTGRTSGSVSGPRNRSRVCSWSRTSHRSAISIRRLSPVSTPSSSTADGTRCGPNLRTACSITTSISVSATASPARPILSSISTSPSSAIFSGRSWSTSCSNLPSPFSSFFSCF